MATFSESQITSLAKILELTSNYLADHLTFYGSQITESDKTEVLVLITTWTTAGGNFTAIEPNVRNFGARIDPNNQKNQIRSQIATLIYAKDLIDNFSSSQGMVTRL